MQLLFKSKIHSQCCKQLTSMYLCLPSCSHRLAFVSVTFVWLCSQTSQENYFAEKGLKKVDFCWFCFPSWLIVRLCECPKGKDSNDCRKAEVWRVDYTVQQQSGFILWLKSNGAALKIEARKAEWVPEMKAELVFPLSTKEPFATQDTDSHRGDGKFWSYAVCLLLSR